MVVTKAIYGAVFTALMLVLSTLFFRVVQEAQPDPYMDEVFHVPQVRRYCNGNYSYWDPMITTLPGLYVVSVAAFQGAVAVANGLVKEDYSIEGMNIKELCLESTFYLRGVNFIFGILTFFLIKCLLDTIQHPQKGSYRARKTDNLCRWLNATAISLFPVHFFFHSMYYTDSGSTFFVLLAYYMGLERMYLSSAAMGAVSILFRQTNVIWVCFVAGVCLVKRLEGDINETMKKDEGLKSDGKPVAFYSIYEEADWKKCLKYLVKCSFKRKNFFSVLRIELGYLMVVCGFVVFVVKNNGIVVGDRSNHVVSLNFPQILYFLAFAAFCALPHVYFSSSVWYGLQKYVERILYNLEFAVRIGFQLSALSFVIYMYSYEHPYLLADNRHYTFYVWKNFFRKSDIQRYLWIPVYVLAFKSIVALMKDSMSRLWLIVYSIAVALVLVPQQLLEFRYFVLPFLIFRLHINTKDKLHVVIADLFLTSCVNLFTLYMFSSRIILWEDGSRNRLMW
eukprot:Nk52_evm8s284 gene=Nk52_evmTU8s284